MDLLHFLLYLPPQWGSKMAYIRLFFYFVLTTTLWDVIGRECVISSRLPSKLPQQSGDSNLGLLNAGPELLNMLTHYNFKMHI